MNFFQTINSAAQRALQHQECTVCLESLPSQPVANLIDSSGNKICNHTIHVSCAHEIHACPCCGKNFSSIQSVPQLSKDNARVWFDYLDADHSGALSYEEILDGLKAQCYLDWNRIEIDADKLWSQWDKDRNMQISFDEFVNPSNGVMVYLEQHYPPAPRSPPPDIRQNKQAWFEYWDEDHSNTLDKDEVARALIKTFRLLHIDRSAVLAVLDMIWPIFDSDNSGKIDKREFVSTDNLGDTIIAQLSFT
jgi:Ca2+-binding EF-hand superfamily protein